MHRKRTIIAGLLGLNLLLLAALILSVSSLPTAQAQLQGRPEDYSMATCQIHEDYEALAVVNNVAGTLYVFVPRDTPAGVRMSFTDSRDLVRDFGRR